MSIRAVGGGGAVFTSAEFKEVAGVGRASAASVAQPRS
nr:MAG TPA: hypothetical protein [Caudoviricetes sp.]